MSLEPKSSRNPLPSGGLFNRTRAPSNHLFLRLSNAIIQSDWNLALEYLKQVETTQLHQDPIFKSIFEENFRGDEGYTLTHCAIVNSQTEILRQLDRLGINVFAATSPRRGASVPGLHLAIEVGAIESIEILLELGANIEEFSSDGLTPLGAALEHSSRGPGPDEIIKTLLAAGADFLNVSDNSLNRAYLQGLRIAADLTNRDLRNANLFATDLSEANLDNALLDNAIYGASTIFPEGFNPSAHGMVAAPLVVDGYGEYELSEDDIVQSIHQPPPWDYLVDHQILGEIAADLSREEELLKENGASIRDIFHYRAAFQADSFPETGDNLLGQPFLRLFPLLTTDFPPRSVDALLKAFEGELDTFRPPLGNHPNMSEFFALLNHPELTDLTPSTVGALTSVITAADRWLDRDDETEVTVKHVKAWRDFGFLCFGHADFKYDTRQIKLGPLLMPAIVEGFGFERVFERETDSKHYIGNNEYSGYGTGYQLKLDPRNRKFLEEQDFPLDRNFYFEARRGYYILSLEKIGTLVVRNNSAHFGRDLLPVPVLFSYSAIDSPYSEEDLQQFDTTEIYQRFKSALNIDLNITKNHIERRLLKLSTAMRSVLRAYDAWKFDTQFPRAFVDRDGDIDGAYNSPGFNAVVEYLENSFLINGGTSVNSTPALAFAVNNQPAWNFCPWNDAIGLENRKLNIDHDRLAVLKRLAEGGRFAVSDEELDLTGIRQFFEAGFRYQGRLVLVDPE